MKRFFVGISVLALIFCSTAPLFAQMDIVAQYEGQPIVPSGEAMVADVLVVRPISIVALAFGAAMSVIATPFALASGTAPEVYGRLLGDPYYFAFCRPLGVDF
jgi:hypothetical protein